MRLAGDRFHGRRSVPAGCRSLECSIDCQHVRGPLPDVRGFDRARRQRGPRRGVARRVETAPARWLHRAARRPASGRIRAGVRCGGVADRFHRFGRSAIVLADRAVIFVDGRYLLQCATRSNNVFAVEHLVDNPPEKWLETNLPAGARFAYDRGCTPRTMPRGFPRRRQRPRDAVPVESNPLDAVWTDRPAPPLWSGQVRELNSPAKRRRTSSPASARDRQLKATR